ncbi:PilZ domain-containing protein [Elusimicrobiota bacterium]
MNLKERKYRRFSTTELRCLGFAGEESMPDICIKNISMGGLAFESNCEILEGTEVYFEFPQEKIIVSGIVKRIETVNNQSLYGVEFRESGFMNKINLSKMISEICGYLISSASIYLNAF